jgi:hypothetical protein
MLSRNNSVIDFHHVLHVFCATGQKAVGSIPDGVFGNVSLTSLRPHYGPGVDSALNRNEYQEYLLGDKGGQCIGLTTIPPSCAGCPAVWEPEPHGIFRACPGLYRHCLTFYSKFFMWSNEQITQNSWITDTFIVQLLLHVSSFSSVCGDAILILQEGLQDL